MRNLKKILALVLALVMSLSLVTMANADFTDAAEIEHKEAVEVMAKAGVLAGLETGAFNPDGILNRAQAAKIVAYVITGGEPAAVTGAPFSDVPASHWAAASIAYVAGKNIVAGNGDGTFSPAGQLTGYAFAKMLLGALEIEGTYTGLGWEINVADAADDAGLLEKLDDVKLGAPLSREHAAQMALNAVKAAPGGEKYFGVDIKGKIVKFDNKSDALLYAGLKDGEYLGEMADAEDTLLKDVFKVTVKTAAAGGADEFGRPATEYSHKDWDLEYAIDAEYTYINEWDEDEAEALDDDEVEYKTATVIYNGKADVLKLDDLTAEGDAVNGYAIEMFDKNDDDKIDTIVVVEQYFAEIGEFTAAKKKTDAKVEVKVYEHATQKTITFTDDDEDDNDDYDKIAAAYEEGDYVAVVLNPGWESKADLMAIEAVEAVEGKISKISSGKYLCLKKVTVDGTAYGLNNEFYAADGAFALKKEGTLYIDAQGNAIGWVLSKDATVTMDDVVYLTDTYSKTTTDDYGTSTTTWYAQIINLEDSSVENIEIIDADKDLTEGLFTYKYDSDKEANDLTEWKGDEDYAVLALGAQTLKADSTKIPADSKTVRLEDETTYIGLSEKYLADLEVETKVGGVAKTTTTGKIIAKKDGSNFVATYVIMNNAADAATSYEDVIYIADIASTGSVLVGEDDVECLVYNAYDEAGDEIELIVKKDLSVTAGFKTFEKDEDDIITKLNAVKDLTISGDYDDENGVITGEFKSLYGTLITVGTASDIEAADAVIIDLRTGDVDEISDLAGIEDAETTLNLVVYANEGAVVIIIK